MMRCLRIVVTLVFVAAGLSSCDEFREQKGDCPAGLTPEECVAHFNSLLDGGSTGGVDAGCSSNTMCTAAVASKCDSGECVACVADSDCSHIEGTNVCDEGTCVECTDDKDASCDGKVCDVAARTCSEGMPSDKTLCEACVATKQCQEHQVCAQLVYGNDDGDDGKRCVWNKAATGTGAPNNDCGTVAPFIATESGLTTLEGETVEACKLSITSCTAYDQFRKKTCDSADAAGHAQCGLGDEGYCMAFNSEFRCTIPCGDVNDDCNAAFSNDCVVFTDSSTGKACDFGL